MIIKNLEVSDSLLENRFKRLLVKFITYPTWRWCKKYGNWYLYNPRHFRETETDLLPIATNKVVDIPLSSNPGDSRFLFVNCGKI